MLFKYIHKHKDKACKEGFTYRFRVRENGKMKTIKTSTNLEKLVAFRNKWLQKHRPDLYKYLGGE